jgi:hypothetical protein
VCAPEPVEPPARPRIVRCPACGGPAVYGPENPYRPFCSARCRQIDLGAWASEQFRLPSREDAPAEAEPPESGKNSGF